jgi:peptidoglycan/LPS O-acetylase OafA/YrhL
MSDLAAMKLAERTAIQVPRSWIKPYYGSFNGLRGVAISLVFFCHFGGSLQGYLNQTWWVGVDLFFVLSGFLITGILFDSLDSPNYFKNFYVRRSLRIFPLFYGFFLAVAVLTPLLHFHFDRGIFAFVFYLGNLLVPFVDLTAHNPTTISVMHHGALLEILNIGHLWSLCVEEQFYLVWPAVVWLLRSRRSPMSLCVGISILTLGVRVFLLAHAPTRELNQHLIYWSTYTRCDTLLTGAWFALFLRGRKLSLIDLRRISASLFWIPLPLLVAGTLYWHSGRGLFANRFLMSMGFTLIGLIAAGALLRSLDEGSLVSRALRFRPLSGLGIISYGFYFYHALPAYLIFQMADNHPRLRNIIPFVWFGLTAFIAWLSFRFYETPFLRLKKVLAPQSISPKGAVVN